MKSVRQIAVFFAVAVAATSATHGQDVSSTNQGTTNNTKTPIVADGSLKEPVKSVLEHYFRIQKALADDSTDGITTNALAIATAVKADDSKTLPSEVGEEADALAKAQELAATRDAFADLSKSLIKYLSDKKVQTGEMEEVFCPMANAYWAQKGQDIVNPYVGHSMPGCGEVKRGF
jgi:Cu(I)/Ag(I) efflux system membrane fusion protein